MKVSIIELKKLMVERSIDSVHELSKASGIRYQTLLAIFSGRKQPTTDAMLKLVKTLEIPASKAGEIFFN